MQKINTEISFSYKQAQVSFSGNWAYVLVIGLAVWLFAQAVNKA